MSKFHKSGNRGKYTIDSQNVKVAAEKKKAVEKIDENSLVFQYFKKYSKELDKKHDKFERIVKLSRDITIESKRIIFLLHSINRASKKPSILNEAESRLQALIFNQWKSLANELHREDHYLYHKAYFAGAQEFIEAFLFFNYIKNENFLHWNYLQNKLKYSALDNFDENTVVDDQNSINYTSVTVIPIDFILGLADVTGELMRKCINSLGDGDVEGCFKTCDFVRNLYSGFLTIGLHGNKEMTQKMVTLRKSLLKMELICYKIQVRGNEVPKYMLADFDTQKSYLEECEGFFE